MKALLVCCQIGKVSSIMKQDTLGKQVTFQMVKKYEHGSELERSQSNGVSTEEWKDPAFCEHARKLLSLETPWKILHPLME